MATTQTRTQTTQVTAKAEWEARFNRWSQGPSNTEQEKCDRAESMVRDAIAAYPGLSRHQVRVFTQGSFRNRTNVRLDSDVDICVMYKDVFIPDYSHVPGVTNASLGFSNAAYKFPDLKRDVEAALVAKFGRAAVTVGDKAFDIKDNTYRVAADVVPTFEGRLYDRDGAGALVYRSGTVLQSTSTGRQIQNYPDQHYNNGVAKHTATSRQFKKKVRCLKNLAGHMADAGYESAGKMASYLLESLIYSCDESAFNKPSHYEDMAEVIRQLWNRTKTDESAKGMMEVNGIKYLFHSSQPWNRADVHQFLLDAWQYVGFGT
jgi:hypothetical protein